MCGDWCRRPSGEFALSSAHCPPCAATQPFPPASALSSLASSLAGRPIWPWDSACSNHRMPQVSSFFFVTVIWEFKQKNRKIPQKSCTGCLAAPLADLPPGEQSMYLLAKTYFDAREFRRCARLLTSCEAPLLVFLRYYSLYLVRAGGSALYPARCRAVYPVFLAHRRLLVPSSSSVSRKN